MCKSLISYEIEGELCVGCGLCVKYCSSGAITGEFKGIHSINQETCSTCGMCIIVCPPKAGALKVVSPKPELIELMLGEVA